MSINESTNKKTTGYSVRVDNVDHDGGFAGADGKPNQSESSANVLGGNISGGAVNGGGPRGDMVKGSKGKDGGHSNADGGFGHPGNGKIAKSKITEEQVSTTCKNSKMNRKESAKKSTKCGSVTGHQVSTRTGSAEASGNISSDADNTSRPQRDFIGGDRGGDGGHSHGLGGIAGPGGPGKGYVIINRGSAKGD